MKKFAFVLLGLFLAAMAVTAAAHASLLDVALGIAFAAGSWRSFKAAGRLAPAPKESERRPWEH